MKQIIQKRQLRLLVAIFLILATLLSLSSCIRKDPSPDPDDDIDEPEVETKMTIGGKYIYNHKILYPEGEGDMALSVRSAISSAADLTLVTTTTDPENGKVIWLRIDPQQSPAYCRVYTEGRKLIISGHTKEFLKEAIELFKTTLRSGTMDFPSDFSISSAHEVIPYKQANGAKKLIGDSNKNPLTYAVGETAVFTVAAVSEDKLLSIPYFHVEVWNEATGTGNDWYEDGSNGYFEYRIEGFSKSGFFYINVNACDEKKEKLTNFVATADNGNHFVGSVCFGADQLNTTGAPADFLSCWQSVASAAQSQNAVGRKLTKLSSTNPKFNLYYWETPSGGTNVYGEKNVAAGYLTVPTSASATNQIGLYMAFQGYSNDIPIPDPTYRENTASLIVCAHGFDLEKAKTDVTYYSKQKARIGNFANAPDYFLDMVKRDLLGAKFLMSYFGEEGNGAWDGVTFEVSGGSMGGMQATAVAALTKDVTGTDVSLLNIDYPWLCDATGGNYGRKPRTWPQKLTELYRNDPTNFAQLVTCKVKIFSGLGDQVCPASGIMIFYNNLKNCAEKTLVFEQNFSHAGGVGGGKYELSQKANQ